MDRRPGRFSGEPGQHSFRGIFSAGIVLRSSACLHLVLAGGLFEREAVGAVPRACPGFWPAAFSVRHVRWGSTRLWVLLPERSGYEYERLAQPGGQVHSASVSS